MYPVKSLEFTKGNTRYSVRMFNIFLKYSRNSIHVNKLEAYELNCLKHY